LEANPERGSQPAAPARRTLAPAHATGAVELIPLDAVVEDPTFRLRETGDVSTLATSLGRLGQLTPVELRRVAEGKWQVVAGFRRVAALRMLQRDRVLARLHDRLAEEDAWGLALGHALLTEPLDGPQLEVVRRRMGELGITWANDLIDEALVRAPVPQDQREKFFDFLTQPQLAPSAEPKPPEPEEPANEPVKPTVQVAPAEAKPTETKAVEARLGPAQTAPAEAEADEAGSEEDEVEEITADDFATDLATRLYAINQDLAAAYEAWSDLPAEGRRVLLEQARYIAELLPFLEERRPEET
jgi:hypothetical protein